MYIKIIMSALIIYLFSGCNYTINLPNLIQLKGNETIEFQLPNYTFDSIKLTEIKKEQLHHNKTYIRDIYYCQSYNKIEKKVLNTYILANYITNDHKIGIDINLTLSNEFNQYLFHGNLTYPNKTSYNQDFIVKNMNDSNSTTFISKIKFNSNTGIKFITINGVNYKSKLISN